MALDESYALYDVWKADSLYVTAGWIKGAQDASRKKIICLEEVALKNGGPVQNRSRLQQSE